MKDMLLKQEAEDKEEIDKLLKEEDINLAPEDMDVAEIDKLTGLPRHNDLVLFAVPMCAPYSTVSQYKYKVKIQPGNLKRGKAVKMMRSLFLNQSGKNDTEASLIKGIPDPDMINVLINSIRIFAPGLTKMQNQQKKDKKSGKKD